MRFTHGIHFRIQIPPAGAEESRLKDVSKPPCQARKAIIISETESKGIIMCAIRFIVSHAIPRHPATLAHKSDPSFTRSNVRGILSKAALWSTPVAL